MSSVPFGITGLRELLHARHEGCCLLERSHIVYTASMRPSRAPQEGKLRSEKLATPAMGTIQHSLAVHKRHRLRITT